MRNTREKCEIGTPLYYPPTEGRRAVIMLYHHTNGYYNGYLLSRWAWKMSDGVIGVSSRYILIGTHKVGGDQSRYIKWVSNG